MKPNIYQIAEDKARKTPNKLFRIAAGWYLMRHATGWLEIRHCTIAEGDTEDIWVIDENNIDNSYRIDTPSFAYSYRDIKIEALALAAYKDNLR